MLSHHRRGISYTDSSPTLVPVLHCAGAHAYLATLAAASGGMALPITVPIHALLVLFGAKEARKDYKVRTRPAFSVTPTVQGVNVHSPAVRAKWRACRRVLPSSGGIHVCGRLFIRREA